VRDFQVALVVDATSGLYERGLRELESIGVKSISVDELLERSWGSRLRKHASAGLWENL
jgi:hypothetical protein